MPQMKSPPRYPHSPTHWPPQDRLILLESTVQDHATILIGYDGQNGLRGDQKKMAAELSELKKWRHKQEVQLQTLYVVGRWIGIAVIVLFGIFGPEEVVDRFLALWKNAKSVTGG